MSVIERFHHVNHRISTFMPPHGVDELAGQGLGCYQSSSLLELFSSLYMVQASPCGPRLRQLLSDFGIIGSLYPSADNGRVSRGSFM